MAKRDARIERLEQAVASAQLEIATLGEKFDAMTEAFGRAEAERREALAALADALATKLEQKVAGIDAVVANNGERLDEFARHVREQGDRLDTIDADYRRLARRLDADADEVAHTAAALLDHIDHARR